jgi:DNA-directed RNA polymerase subunit RPC12/RpoP
MEKDKIPYIVMDQRVREDTTIDCESVCKEELDERLLKVLQECMEYHEFWFVDEEKLFELEENLESLECDECGCRVVLKKYITVMNQVKYCGACKPSVKIDKGIYDRFQKFLDKKGSTSEIWYFEDNEWIKFTVE